MRRFLLAIALVLPLSFTTMPAFAEPSATLAPADRYFGRLKMSILGIRNSLRDLDAKVAADPTAAEDVFHKASLVEDCLRDWQAHFPADPWIPKYAYALARLYARIDSKDAKERRDAAFDWLDEKYPDSPEAALPR